MAANKRTKAQREMDLEKLAEMRLEGRSQNEMAQTLGISQSQVSQELKKLDERWQKAIANTERHKAREVAKLDHLEGLFHVGYKHSQEGKETKVAEKITAGDYNHTRAVSRHEQRDGNPAFLHGVAKCIEQRCKILGIGQGDPVNVNISQNKLILGMKPEVFAALPNEEKIRILKQP